LFNQFFIFSDVSYLSDSPQNAKTKLLYKIILPNGNKQDHALKKLKDQPGKDQTRVLVWSICDIKFQTIMLVFQVKLSATLARGNAASFCQSYAVKGT